MGVGVSYEREVLVTREQLAELMAGQSEEAA